MKKKKKKYCNTILSLPKNTIFLMRFFFKNYSKPYFAEKHAMSDNFLFNTAQKCSLLKNFEDRYLKNLIQQSHVTFYHIMLWYNNNNNIKNTSNVRQATHQSTKVLTQAKFGVYVGPFHKIPFQKTYSSLIMVTLLGF